MASYKPRNQPYHGSLLKRRFYHGLQEDSHEFFENLLELVKGPVRALFTGSMCSIMRCRRCDEELSLEQARENFTSLSPPLTSGSSMLESTADAVKELLAEENVLWSENCAHCGRSDWSKRMKITKMPEIMCLQLKRWTYDSRAGVIHHQVSPSSQLEVQGTAYKLCSVVCHQGPTPRAGHYVALCHYGDKVWLYNDAMRREATASEVQTCTVYKSYMLLYARVTRGSGDPLGGGPASSARGPEHDPVAHSSSSSGGQGTRGAPQTPVAAEEIAVTEATQAPVDIEAEGARNETLQAAVAQLSGILTATASAQSVIDTPYCESHGANSACPAGTSSTETHAALSSSEPQTKELSALAEGDGASHASASAQGATSEVDALVGLDVASIGSDVPDDDPETESELHSSDIESSGASSSGDVSETSCEAKGDVENSKTEVECKSPSKDENIGEEAPSDKEAEEECFSDVSDNSDIFHVEAVQTELPRTREDEDLARVQRLRAHMRSFPLLPPRRDDAQESFMDVDSGVRLPALHCAFKGCGWTSDVPVDRHFGMDP